MRRNNFTGKKIRQLRADHDMTQDELADRMYCARSAISKLETGMRDPTYQEIECMCRIFGCTPNDFFSPEMCGELKQWYDVIRLMERFTPLELSRFLHVFGPEDDSEE